MANNYEEIFQEKLDLFWESKRLASFKKWPYSNKAQCNSLKMAEAGFFWTGTIEAPDSAQCFICNKHLDGWEKTDIPWKEHAKHSPQCPFVKVGKPEALITLDQFHELWIKLITNLVEGQHKDDKNKLEEMVKRMKSNLKKIK